MQANRIRHLQASPRPAAAKSSGLTVPPGFAICPLPLATTAWQQEIYRLAYEQARAATAVPRYHRMLFSVWN
jgi:hypothetical protein